MQPQFPDLAGIFGNTSMVPAMDAPGRNQLAYDTANLNNAKGLQDILFKEQSNPLDLATKQLSNSTLEAQLPGVKAQSSILDRNNRMGEATYESDLAGKLSTNKTKLREDEAKQLQDFAGFLGGLSAAAEKGLSLQQLQSLPPEVAQMVSQPGGAAKLREISQQIIAASPTNVAEQDKLKTQGRNQLGVVGAQIKGQKELEQMRIDAGKYVKSNQANLTIEQNLTKLKKASEKVAYLDSVMPFIEDQELINKFTQIRGQLLGQAQAELNANPRPAADLTALGAGGGIQAVPQPQIAPNAIGQQPQQPADPNLSRLPQGSKPLGNGIYQLPDGTKVRAKQ